MCVHRCSFITLFKQLSSTRISCGIGLVPVVTGVLTFVLLKLDFVACVLCSCIGSCIGSSTLHFKIKIIKIIARCFHFELFHCFSDIAQPCARVLL